MKDLVTCLWYDGNAEEAARFYTSLLPDSSVVAVTRWPEVAPPDSVGQVLTVEFTMLGQKYLGLNGGPRNKFNEAVSFMVMCETQEEVDHLWEALIANGGEPSYCGWLKDRWGMSWQITPIRLMELMKSPDRARAGRVMQAMMTMTKIDIATIEAAAGKPPT